MSDDEADPELVALLRQHFAGKLDINQETDTGVLSGAEAVYDESIDVAVDMISTKRAAATIHDQMARKGFSTASWNEHELHPDSGEWDDEETLNFIFTIDLLNFSFWSELPDDERFAIEYRGKRWTGYWSLVAGLRRAMDEGIPITDPEFWCTGEDEAAFGKDSTRQTHEENGETIKAADAETDAGIHTEGRQADGEDGVKQNGRAKEGDVAAEEDGHAANDENSNGTSNGHGQSHGHAPNPSTAPPSCTLATLRHIFRSATAEEMPMLPQRLSVLREAGLVLRDKYFSSVADLVDSADASAAKLVNTLASDFPCFRDEHRFDGRRKPVRFLKRAQIFVADVWACFDGGSFGSFADIDKLTIFADYRVPQILNILGCLYYAPALAAAINGGKEIESGSRWEMQIRACSIWCVELIKRQIMHNHPEEKVNAVLIDFFLYDTVKELEGTEKETVKHHRTRSIWY